MRWLAGIVVGGWSLSVVLAGCDAAVGEDGGVDHGPAGDDASTRSDANEDANSTPSTLHVLFIGNSYTIKA